MRSRRPEPWAANSTSPPQPILFPCWVACVSHVTYVAPPPRTIACGLRAAPVVNTAYDLILFHPQIFGRVRAQDAGWIGGPTACPAGAYTHSKSCSWEWIQRPDQEAKALLPLGADTRNLGHGRCGSLPTSGLDHPNARIPRTSQRAGFQRPQLSSETETLQHRRRCRPLEVCSSAFSPAFASPYSCAPPQPSALQLPPLSTSQPTPLP